MKLVRIVGLCLVAVFAFSAIAAASASATEILFELPAGSNFPAGFTAKPGSINKEAKLETSNGGSVVTCSEGATVSIGKIENAHLGLALILFKKCSTTVLGIKLPCQNAKTEEIVADLQFHLGLAALKEGETHTVRALLFLLPGGKFVFNCTSSAKIEVTGEVIGELVPNKLATMGPNANAVLKFEGDGLNPASQKYKFFQLQLGGTLMSNIDLKSSLNGGAAELAVQLSENTVEKFTDSAGKAIEFSESLV